MPRKTRDAALEAGLSIQASMRPRPDAAENMNVTQLIKEHEGLLQ